jgi:ribosomal RNA-processing protein 12
MALARLLHEFAPRLRLLVPSLLPAVLMLLRSRSREIIKSVLGFVKVSVCRYSMDCCVS